MRRPRFPLIFAAFAVVLAPEFVCGQTSYPMVTRVTPTAAKRGETVEITIAGGGKCDGAWQLLCQEPGLSGEILKGSATREPQPKTRRGGRQTGMSKARLTVAADAPLGPREIRVATPQGVSSVGLVVVVDDPVVTETDDRANDRPEGAHRSSCPPSSAA